MALTHLEWSALEYHYHPKTADWYWAVAIIAVSIAVTSVIFSNILFAFFIAVAATGLCIVAARRPQVLSCAINERGIIINKRLFPFTTLESFWVEDHIHIEKLGPHHTPKIILKSKKVFMPFIVVPIDIVDAEEVRNILLSYLPEVEHMEPLGQKMMENLGF